MTLGARLDEEGVHGEAFNFGPHEHDIHNSDLASRLCALWGGGINWRHTPPVDPFPEIPRQTLAWDKARQRLDWSPAYTLDEGLQDTITWYKGYREGKPLDELNLYLLSRHQQHARKRDCSWAR
jgi:CDP-glucose 4,6-dehydratase